VNQRLLTGLFLLAISLALVAAAVTAQERPVESLGSGIVSLAVPRSAPDPPPGTEAATARVPLRSADPARQTVPGRPDDVAPVSVRIEALGLEAQVLSVGVDDDNLFDVPEAQKVGWYKYGAAPGETGSTVLAAHVDFGGRPGAFFDLAELATGETLEVELADGSIQRYRVVDNTLYDKTALPADELFRKDGEEVLRLITCGGAFDSAERSYLGNVVVTAQPIDV
jgi:LPXTG-site transpeptidase (sortase) family protein